MVHRRVEDVPVVGDQEHAVRILLHIGLEPERAFQVEIVGGLVEEQEVRLGEEHGRERDAHPPAAGEVGAGSPLVRRVKAEAGEDRRRARFRRMGVDVGKADLDVGDAHRIGRRLRLREKGEALGVGGEHEVDQALSRPRRLLRHPPQPRPRFSSIEPLSGLISPRSAKTASSSPSRSAPRAPPSPGHEERPKPPR